MEPSEKAKNCLIQIFSADFIAKKDMWDGISPLAKVYYQT